MNTELVLIKGDITKVSADAIVNAANSRLAGGGGVDGAIHRAGGPEIMKELDEIRKTKGRCPAGQAVITGAGKLPARWVIHAVGPVWKGGSFQEEELLSSAYRFSMQLAREAGAGSISFPNISTGVYGFPKEKAAPVALQAVKREIQKYPHAFEKIIFVCFDDENYTCYQRQMSVVFSEIENIKLVIET